MSENQQIQAAWINDTIRIATLATPDPRTQFAILTYAFVLMCKSREVTKEKAMEIVGKIFDDNSVKMVPLDEAP